MKYKSILTTSEKATYTGYVEFNNPDSEHIAPLYINDMILETHGFESLSLENPELYTQRQLDAFQFQPARYASENLNPSVSLLNYSLQTFIAITILDTHTGISAIENLTITTKHDKEGYTISCELLGHRSTESDLPLALQEIQAALAARFVMQICCNCKNATTNPYPGNTFMDHLCFVKQAQQFQKLNSKDSQSIIKFMKYDPEKNFKNVLLTHTCKDFQGN